MTPDEIQKANKALLDQATAQVSRTIFDKVILEAAKKVSRPPQSSSDDVWYAALDFTIRFEGQVPYMYNDFGNSSVVTFGIGYVPTSKSDLHTDVSYFYQQSDPTQPATVTDMDADYDGVTKIVRKNYSLTIRDARKALCASVTSEDDLKFNTRIFADCFEFVNKLRITDEGIGRTMARKLRAKADTSFGDKTAGKRLSEFSQYPAQAQIACIAFWYGCVAPVAKKMCKALALWDFDEAAEQSWWAGMSPWKQLGLRTLLYNAARLYEQSHVLRNGQWVYDAQNPKARKLPEYVKSNVIKIEPWLPWTEGNLEFGDDPTDKGNYIVENHTAAPTGLKEPQVTDPNPDKKKPPCAFKYQDVVFD